MKIKLKLGVSEQKKEMVVTPDELGYTDEQWDYMEDEERNKAISHFVDLVNENDAPYWYLESFKTL